MRSNLGSVVGGVCVDVSEPADVLVEDSFGVDRAEWLSARVFLLEALLEGALEDELARRAGRQSGDVSRGDVFPSCARLFIAKRAPLLKLLQRKGARPGFVHSAACVDSITARAGRLSALARIDVSLTCRSSSTHR